MKTLTEKQSLTKLQKLKKAFQNLIRTKYEPRARDCRICPTKGACCTDEHFVNVHITRLEAVAVQEALAELPETKQLEIYQRAEQTIRKYDLKETGNTFARTYACPLFEKEAGCLVHKKAKPAPCIQHACYENRADLPPERLQTETEKAVERLNRRTYGNAWNWLPLPVWLARVNPKSKI